MVARGLRGCHQQRQFQPAVAAAGAGGGAAAAGAGGGAAAAAGQFPPQADMQKLGALAFLRQAGPLFGHCPGQYFPDFSSLDISASSGVRSLGRIRRQPSVLWNIIHTRLLIFSHCYMTTEALMRISGTLLRNLAVLMPTASETLPEGLALKQLGRGKTRCFCKMQNRSVTRRQEALVLVCWQTLVSDGSESRQAAGANEPAAGASEPSEKSS